jgi:hypothetical protein
VDHVIHRLAGVAAEMLNPPFVLCGSMYTNVWSHAFGDVRGAD